MKLESFEIAKHLKTIKMRMILTIALLALISVFSMTNVSLILEMSLLLPENAQISLHDYIIGIFNSSQLVMFFAFPIMFSILCSDVINGDFSNGYAAFVFQRVQSRWDYLLAKFFLICFLAVLFTVISKFIMVVAGLAIFNLSVGANNHHFVILAVETHSIWLVYWQTFVLFVMGLIFIGMLTMVVSLYTKSSGLAVGCIVILSFVHNALYVTSSNFLVLLPFTQYILGLHNNFGYFGLGAEYFTITFSQAYLIIGLIAMMFILYRKIIAIDIYTAGKEK